MNLDKLLNEMGKELLPSLTSKEDLASLVQLRKLYKKDLVQFEDKLKRINTIRRAEGLEPIHKNEVIGKSVKQDIKKVMGDKKAKDKAVVKKNKTAMSNSNSSLKFFPSYDVWWDFIKDVKNEGELFKKFEKPYRLGKYHIRTYTSFGKKFFIVTEEDSESIEKVIGVYNSPTPYKIVQPNEVRFPEIKKKINFAKTDLFWGGNRPRIEKL